MGYVLKIWGKNLFLEESCSGAPHPQNIFHMNMYDMLSVTMYRLYRDR